MEISRTLDSVSKALEETNQVLDGLPNEGMSEAQRHQQDALFDAKRQLRMAQQKMLEAIGHQEISGKEVEFEAGKTYSTRSLCDHGMVISITIARRTAKTVVTSEGKRLKIRKSRGVETVSPWGQHSMAPIIGADDVTDSRDAQ